MFEPAPPDVSFPALERELLALWKRDRIFERSIEEAKGRPRFTFYEGPPTANGVPHWGHVLTRVAKDVFLRYKTMCGFEVPRRSGWDTHGLPVEVEVQKELKLPGKAEVEAFGIEAFTRRCVESVWRYIGEWERMSDRVGFWLHREGYATYHRSYVESVWWALSELFKRGLLYQDMKSVWWWPQGNTALSAGEVGEGYRAVDDPSVVVRFPVAGRPGTFLLAWTTTPWTLPSNVALAVGPDVEYREMRSSAETLVVADALADALFKDKGYEKGRGLRGREMLGWRYEPLFPFRKPEGKAYEVVAGDFVTLDTGTGIVHVAPAFGEDDNRLAKKLGLAFLQLVEPDGRMSKDAGDFKGLMFKEADKPIARNLKERGLLFSQGTYRHDYPFSPRAPDDPLMQYARKSWFIRTSGEKDKVVANNSRIRWQPEHIRDGRMGDFLRNNVDWAISRERWWGTPLPIWVNDVTGKMETVSSVAEILARNPRAFAKFEEAKRKDPSLHDDLMVHKPWIDDVTWTNPGEKGVYRRVPEVIDCWFDAGSMPFAQWGYPHKGRKEFEAAFPADFITEAIDQTRGWWNALLQISTLLFPDAKAPHPFKSCVCLGHITDEEGKKLSKRLRNYVPPMEALEAQGADAVRWALFVSSVPGQNTKFGPQAANEATRDLLLKVWNVFSFLVTYGNIDKWDPRAPRPKERATLDRWVLAELDATVHDVRRAFDGLESHTAARRIAAFVDALSNWYVRRSRPRFWAGGDGEDKRAAFATLYEALEELARLLAPLAPFLSDILYRRLVLPFFPEAPPSVHLVPYPEPRKERQDEELRRSMGLARDLVALGLRVRNESKLKVRQPLREAIVVLAGGERLDRFADAIAEELNVKEVRATDEPARYVHFTVAPNFKALGPKLGKAVPHCKKALEQADGAALHAALEEKGGITVELPDGPVTLTRDEVQVRLAAREGYAAASEHGRVVVIDTRVTDELRREGLAREALSRIQGARKEMKLPYEARIEVAYAAEGDLAQAISEHRAWIMGEALATRLDAGAPAGTVHEADVEGLPFRFGIRRVR
ncbi:MAG: isoleucine--tRNA ligase [Planctomycetes bacterium]|nr:isoleucine--tRNA ligase [Planctomycetota bacterium]